MAAMWKLFSRGRETRLWKMCPMLIGVPKDIVMLTVQEWHKESQL